MSEYATITYSRKVIIPADGPEVSEEVLARAAAAMKRRADILAWAMLYGACNPLPPPKLYTRRRFGCLSDAIT